MTMTALRSLSSVLAALGVLAVSTLAGGATFDFVEVDTGKVLATVELGNPYPYRASSVVSLTWTEAASAAISEDLGFVVPAGLYPGTFTWNINSSIVLGPGPRALQGLWNISGIAPSGAAVWWSQDAPDGQGGHTYNVRLGAKFTTDAPDPGTPHDFITYHRDETVANRSTLWGEWKLTSPSGDYDIDGDVDGRDLLVWQRALGASAADTFGDGNHDGHVDGDDLEVWKSQAAPSATSLSLVPEPSAAVLLFMTITLTACRWPCSRRS